MADTLELEVATPERELVREMVSDLQVPGKNGYMGILPGHAPLLGLLGIGTLTYVSASDGKKRYLSIHCGFLEVLDDHVRVRRASRGNRCAACQSGLAARPG